MIDPAKSKYAAGGRFPAIGRAVVLQGNGLRTQAVDGSANSNLASNGRADNAAPAWRADALCLDGRIQKLQRNAGLSPTKRARGGGSSVQKELAALAPGDETGASALCLRKVDALATLTLEVTVGGVPSASNGQKAYGNDGAAAPLSMMPSSLLALSERCLGLSELVKKFKGSATSSASNAAASDSLSAATAAATAAASDWKAKCVALEAKYSGRAADWKVKGEALASQRDEAQFEAATWKARCEAAEAKAAEIAAVNQIEANSKVDAPPPSPPPSTAAAAEESNAPAVESKDKNRSSELLALLQAYEDQTTELEVAVADAAEARQAIEDMKEASTTAAAEAAAASDAAVSQLRAEVADARADAENLRLALEDAQAGLRDARAEKETAVSNAVAIASASAVNANTAAPATNAADTTDTVSTSESLSAEVATLRSQLATTEEQTALSMEAAEAKWAAERAALIASHEEAVRERDAALGAARGTWDRQRARLTLQLAAAEATVARVEAEALAEVEASAKEQEAFMAKVKAHAEAARDEATALEDDALAAEATAAQGSSSLVAELARVKAQLEDAEERASRASAGWDSASNSLRAAVAALEEQSSKTDHRGLIGGHHHKSSDSSNDGSASNNNDYKTSATAAGNSGVSGAGLSSSWGEHTAEARISELEIELKQARKAGAQARAAAARATTEAQKACFMDVVTRAAGAVNRASAAEDEGETEGVTIQEESKGVDRKSSNGDEDGVCAALEKRIARALGALLTNQNADSNDTMDDDDSGDGVAGITADTGGASVDASAAAAAAEDACTSLARAVATCAAREAERHHILLAGALQEERLRAQEAAEAAGRDALALHAAKHRDQVQAAKAQREQLEQQLLEAREVAAHERRSGEAAAQATREEIAGLNGRVSSLMAKVKELCSASADGKAFGDSYEEVLAEEMAAMKTAFEAKLREKQRQIDELRRGRHKGN